MKNESVQQVLRFLERLQSEPPEVDKPGLTPTDAAKQAYAVAAQLVTIALITDRGVP